MHFSKVTPAIVAVAASFGVSLILYFGVSWHILNLLITPERQQGAVPTAASLGVSEVRPVLFNSLTDETVLQGWFIPNQGNRAIILLHGLHSRAWGCHTTDLVQAYSNAGFAVFTFDLRGHGLSGGEHLGLGLLEKGDVRASVDFLLEQGFRPSEIGIHGTSYGGATTLLALEGISEVAAVVSDSAFADMRDVVGGELERQTGLPKVASQLLMPGLRLLGKIQYSVDIARSAPERSIGQISPRPILLIHGDRDEVIPYNHAQRLKQSAGSNTELWTLPTKHTEGVRLGNSCELAPTRDAFLSKVTLFFDTHLATAQATTDSVTDSATTSAR